MNSEQKYETTKEQFALAFLRSQGWWNVDFREDGCLVGFPDGWADDYYFTRNPLNHLREATRYFRYLSDSELEKFRKSEAFARNLVRKISTSQEELALNYCLALFEWQTKTVVEFVEKGSI